MLTTLGGTLVVLIAMLGAAAYLKSGLKEDIQQMGTGLKEDIQQMGTGLKEDIQQMGTDLKEDIQQMGTDLKGEIQQMGASVRRLDDRACFLTTVIQHHLSVPSDDLPGVPETKPSAPPPSASRGSAPDRNPSQT